VLDTELDALPVTGVDEVLAVDAVEALPAKTFTGEPDVVAGFWLLPLPSCFTVRIEV